MKNQIIAITKKALLTICLFITAASFANAQGQHPAYLHALSDLRAARWMIQHRPGDWVQSSYETSAVREIDAAINDIKAASIFDGKNIEDHPALDERNDHNGRLHESHDFLKKARQDISQEEDNPYTRQLRNRSYKHIDVALDFVKSAMHS